MAHFRLASQIFHYKFKLLYNTAATIVTIVIIVIEITESVQSSCYKDLFSIMCR